MSYQTFTARSVEEAKRAMRDELGEDAVILATRRHPDGTVEMRAIKKGKPLFRGEGGSRGGFFGGRARPAPSPQAPSLGGGRDVRVEEDSGRPASSAAQNLRGDFSRNLDRGHEARDPLFQYYQSFLGPQGLSADFIAALVEEAHNSGVRGEAERLSYALSRILTFAPIEHSPDLPLMLVGQTGAGKTSSAAKLAARAAGIGEQIAFMSADIGRAGAIEQMTTYSEALDTRFWPIDDPDGLADILHSEQPDEQIVLDTPGVSPYASADVAAMRAFRDVLGAEAVLVIPASGDIGEHTDWVRAFADIGVRRCIITKFDTSRRIGAAVAACYETGMAIAHFSEAPFIADGLVDANPDYLAYRLMLEEPGRIASRR